MMSFFVRVGNINKFLKRQDIVMYVFALSIPEILC